MTVREVIDTYLAFTLTSESQKHFSTITSCSESPDQLVDAFDTHEIVGLVACKQPLHFDTPPPQRTPVSLRCKVGRGYRE